jgi:hypothetical protein
VDNPSVSTSGHNRRSWVWSGVVMLHEDISMVEWCGHAV